MNLPVYQHINLKSSNLEDLKRILEPDLNLKQPVVLNLKNFSLEEQRELIGLIENHFFTQNISYHFPYPIYLLTDHENSISNMAMIKDIAHLPRFYNQKEGKLNVKESHIISRNKLLQVEIKNADAQFCKTALEAYADTHKKIHDLECEGQFYKSILNKLTKATRHG